MNSKLYEPLTPRRPIAKNLDLLHIPGTSKAVQLVIFSILLIASMAVCLGGWVATEKPMIYTLGITGTVFGIFSLYSLFVNIVSQVEYRAGKKEAQANYKENQLKPFLLNSYALTLTEKELDQLIKGHAIETEYDAEVKKVRLVLDEDDEDNEHLFLGEEKEDQRSADSGEGADAAVLVGFVPVTATGAYVDSTDSDSSAGGGDSGYSGDSGGGDGGGGGD
jgi:uncharacterized membrane protein YgcG